MNPVKDMELSIIPIRLLFAMSRELRDKTEQDMAALLQITPEEYSAMEYSVHKGFTGSQQNLLYQYYKEMPDSFDNLIAVWLQLFDVLEKAGRGDDVYRHLWDSIFTLHELIADALVA